MSALWFVYITVFLVGMVHVPIIVDVLRFVFPKWKLSRLTTRVIKYLLISIMTTIYCIALGYHFLVFLPLLSAVMSLKWIFHLVFACWLWINMIVNYTLAVFLNPGEDKAQDAQRSTVGTTAQNGDGSGQILVAGATAQDNSGSGCPNQTNITFRPQRATGDAASSVMSQDNSTHAETSLNQDGVNPQHGMEWKPKRSFFCKACQITVLHMDHHCPFTGNCVGFKNYSHFYLWLLYGTIGLAYAALVTFPFFSECKLKNVWWFFGFVESREKSPVCEDLGAHPNIFLPIIAGCWICVNMLTLQTLTLLTDISTFNFIVNIRKLPLLRFAWQRIKGGKCREPNSRLNVLLLRQRKSMLWFLVPVRNVLS